MASTFYPTIASRSSQPLAIHRLMFQVNNDQSAIRKLEEQLSTGRRITRASEDPAAAIRALAAQRQQEYKNQILDNVVSATSILSVSETSLAQSQTILNEIKGVAISAADSTNSPAELEAMIAQVDAALQKLVEIGNTQINDQFLFSGTKIGSPPLNERNGGIVFSGTADEFQTITDYASTLATNVTANDAFGVRSTRVVGSVDLNPNPTLATNVSSLNGGQGVNLGAILLSDGSTAFSVDLSKAFTLDDIKRTIEAQQLGSRDLVVNLVGRGLEIDFADGLGGILRIDEVGAGNTAAELGILANGSANTAPISGGDLDPLVTNSTQLAQLFQGSGIASGSSFRIQQGSRTYNVSTAGMTTIEDLINGIHRSGARVVAEISSDGRHLTVQSVESGTTLSIGENGSGLASQLGIRTFDSNTLVSDLNFGLGIFESNDSYDLDFTRTDGSLLRINLDGVQTVGEVIERINNNVDNFTPSLRIVASLAPTGNGLVLTAQAGAQQLSVTSPGGSSAAFGLGLVPKGSTAATGVSSGTNSVINGADVSGVEVEGAFTSMIRLRDAIRNNSLDDIDRIAAAIDDDILRLSMARGETGTRLQSLDFVRDRTEDQNIQLKETESNQLDADLAQTISELTSRQAALQASLQLLGRANQLTLFNYI